MKYLTLSVLASALMALSAFSPIEGMNMQQLAHKVNNNNDNNNKQTTPKPTTQPSAIPFKNVQVQAICPDLAPKGCTRYTRGFDVTGVVTEVDLTFPQVQSACDCIQECLNRPTTCASYVYKFSTPASVQSGHRTCTLYSQFNLPTDVTLEFDLANGNNKNINAAEISANGNNPQAGGLVPQAFMDANLNAVADPDAVSGPIWQLANGQTQC